MSLRGVHGDDPSSGKITDTPQETPMVDDSDNESSDAEDDPSVVREPPKDIHGGMNEALVRHKVAEAAYQYDWTQLTLLLTSYPQFVNSVRPGGRARFTPLHQAAYGGATAAVVEKLLALGADRHAVDARGRTPAAVAKAQKNVHLLPLLT